MAWLVVAAVVAVALYGWVAWRWRARHGVAALAVGAAFTLVVAGPGAALDERTGVIAVLVAAVLWACAAWRWRVKQGLWALAIAASIALAIAFQIPGWIPPWQ